MVVNKIWKYGELDTKVDVYEINATMMRFRISGSKAREKILKRGMWNIAGVPMVVTKWSPKTEEEKQEENEIPMWVHLRKVPLHMYSWEGISFMSSTVGFPDRLHPETIACTNMEVAKVFVNVDISKQLRKEIDFTKDGKEFTVEFHYPWLPAKCNLCGKWGHTERVCVKNGKEKKMRVDNKDLSKGSRVKEAREPGTSHEGKEKEQEIIDANMSPQGKQEDKSPSSLKEVNISNWSLVSPAKAGRSQLTQSHVPEIQISASKFSVLVEETEEVEEGEFLEDGPENNEDEKLDVSELSSELEGGQLEDDILEQHTKEKNKVGVKKGMRRVQRVKAQDANPKSTRPSRKKTDMASFFWNVRGFNKSLKHSVVKQWLGNKDMKFGCLLETRVKETKAERILKEEFKDWSMMNNYDCSQGGRIWVLWRDSVCMTPVYKSDQLITCSVGVEKEEDFFCTFVYARNQVEQRKELWDDLCDHHDSAMFKNKEWVIMGDFNEILDGEENSRFSSLERLPRGMRDFQRAVLHCHLSDLGYQGPRFTWSNKQEE